MEPMTCMQVAAHDKNQKYKEGKFVLERYRIGKYVFELLVSVFF